jgi:hypothetical protein
MGILENNTANNDIASGLVGRLKIGAEAGEPGRSGSYLDKMPGDASLTPGLKLMIWIP